ncbi:MAG: hypothetical protein AAFX99_15420, partial [Myxococcota bacterium]
MKKTIYRWAVAACLVSVAAGCADHELPGDTTVPPQSQHQQRITPPSERSSQEDTQPESTVEAFLDVLRTIAQEVAWRDEDHGIETDPSSVDSATESPSARILAFHLDQGIDALGHDARQEALDHLAQAQGTLDAMDNTILSSADRQQLQQSMNVAREMVSTMKTIVPSERWKLVWGNEFDGQYDPNDPCYTRDPMCRFEPAHGWAFKCNTDPDGTSNSDLQLNGIDHCSWAVMDQPSTWGHLVSYESTLTRVADGEVTMETRINPNWADHLCPWGGILDSNQMCLLLIIPTGVNFIHGYQWNVLDPNALYF